MATQTIKITTSDFTGKEIEDPKLSCTVTVKFADGRKGSVVADASTADKIVQDIIKAGRQQQRRGRRPKSES